MVRTILEEKHRKRQKHEVPLTFPGERHLVLCVGVGGPAVGAAGATACGPAVSLAGQPFFSSAKARCSRRTAASTSMPCALSALA